MGSRLISGIIGLDSSGILCCLSRFQFPSESVSDFKKIGVFKTRIGSGDSFDLPRDADAVTQDHRMLVRLGIVVVRGIMEIALQIAVS